jgi:S-adenosylmethionine hydrolase
VKSVIRSIAPHAAVIDITHEIPAHDMRAGALALARAAQYLCPGIVLAVVDPGVGTDRRAVAIEVGEGQSYLVGPDNGLLASAVALSGGATAAVALTNTELQLPAPGSTFAGRDIFGPAAAHLANGVPFADLGEAVDVDTLVPGIIPITHEREGVLIAQVLWVDRYGNIQLNVDPDELPGGASGGPVLLAWGSQSRVAKHARAYDDIAVGDIGLVVDSYGLVSVAAARSSASLELALVAGDEVRLTAGSEDGSPGEGRSSPVSLRPRTAT